MIGADRFVDALPPAAAAKHATQRYARGISDIDMWNFDVFLADAIVYACDWHMRQGNTSPWHVEKGEWENILNVIRDGFAARDEWGNTNPPKRAWNLLRKNFRYFWD